jgi:hypothetical protein
MVKDEEDIIYQFLKHNHLLGFRNFALLNNGSTDQTVPHIRNFQNDYPEANLVIIEDPVVGYYQDTKTTAASKFASTYFSMLGQKIDWIFPLDADEFITFSNSDRNLNDILGTMDERGKKVLEYYLCDATSSNLDVSFTSKNDPFKTFDSTSRFLAHSIPKVAFRYNEGAHLLMGNHFVTGCAYSLDDLQHAAEFGIYLTHFALRGPAHAKRKYVNGGKAYKAAADREAHGGRWKKQYDMYLLHGDEYFVRHYREYVRKTLNAAGS